MGLRSAPRDLLALISLGYFFFFRVCYQGPCHVTKSSSHSHGSGMSHFTTRWLFGGVQGRHWSIDPTSPKWSDDPVMKVAELDFKFKIYYCINTC